MGVDGWTIAASTCYVARALSKLRSEILGIFVSSWLLRNRGWREGWVRGGSLDGSDVVSECRLRGIVITDFAGRDQSVWIQVMLVMLYAASQLTFEPPQQQAPLVPELVCARNVGFPIISP